MTPKEKAEELVDKFIQYVPAEEEFEWDYAKQCALIAVDELIFNAHNNYMEKYWQEVKQEIINL
jgi:hypothetical protein